MSIAPPLIVGIVLVRNEELYLGRALDNIRRFCDRILIADHRSVDDTPGIARSFCAANAHAEYHAVADPKASHDLIRGFAGRRVWIFGVDGDEIYEPDRLALLRTRIRSGNYERFWMLLGNALNCVSLDGENGLAAGYLAPPCRSMTKLYNFDAIESWEGECSERLHGGSVVFKPGFGPHMRHDIYKQTPWEESVFRCLHLCFIPRSRVEKGGKGGLVVRRNIADGISESLPRRLTSRFLEWFGVPASSALKRAKYMRGPEVTLDVRSFFREEGA